MKNPEVIFRKYKPGDEESVVSVINSSLDAFRDFGLTKEIWLGYEKIDPSFKAENALVAEYEGKIVGHVQIVRRKVKLGDTCYVNMGGIANVSTIPEARRRGISTTLMTNAIDYCVKEGIPLSGLFTGYGNTAHRVYRRVGYEDTVLFTSSIGTVDEMRRVKDNCGETSDVHIRHYEKGDEEEILDTYVEWSKAYSGMVERSLEYWKKKLVERSTTHTFFYGDFDPEEVFVAVENGKVSGYAYVTLCKKRKVPYRPPEAAVVREIAFKPGHFKALSSLIDAIMDFFISENVKICEAAFPADEAYLNIFRPFRQMPQSIFMVHVPLIEKLFEEARGDLEKRLSLTPYVGSSMTIGFETPYGSMKLGLHSGELGLQPEKEPTVKIFFDSNCFTRMIFGIETIQDLISKNMVRIHTTQYLGKVISVIQALFPKRAWFISPIDHW